MGAFLVGMLALGMSSLGRAGEADLRGEAAKALSKAIRFFRQRVATEGGYLWRYSEDLSKREGEGKASPTTVWVQPPGTPSVGMAMLEAYKATGDPYYLEGARQAGYCLLRGQLESGGWTYRIEFNPADRRRFRYRADGAAARPKARNVSTLDDNTTQAALQLLMRLDEVLGFQDAKIHEGAEYALQHLLAVQYPNGAWPQGFERPPDPARHPVKKAQYPESWARVYPGGDYWHYYTLNDNALGDTIEVLLEAWRVYKKQQYMGAARRAGDFLLLAQMPHPQPAWAQQYDFEMHPAWARKFEPPAITGGESQGVLRTLLEVYRQTGDRKYLEPIPRAIAYLRHSELPSGRLARFYELKTNRPLYFTRKYELTYRDDDLPTHYAFQVPSRLDAIEAEYRRLLASGAKPRPAQPGRPANPSPRLVAQVKAVIAALDDQGRWIEAGKLRYHGKDDPTQRIIDCQTFIANVRLLSTYLAAAGP